jgi:hypothetical protein
MRAGNRRGRVASVIGIDHDYHGFANSLPDRPAKPKVLVEAEAELELDLDLDLDRLKARTRPLLFQGGPCQPMNRGELRHG